MATARQLDQSTTSLYEQDFFIQGQRRELARLIKQSPSLKAFIPEVLNELWQDAREDAEIETGMPIKPSLNPVRGIQTNKYSIKPGGQNEQMHRNDS